MVAYQRLITSASNQLPFANWCTYEVKFRTLAAVDTTLRWDQRHIELWLECTAPLPREPSSLSMSGVPWK